MNAWGSELTLGLAESEISDQTCLIRQGCFKTMHEMFRKVCLPCISCLMGILWYVLQYLTWICWQICRQESVSYPRTRQRAELSLCALNAVTIKEPPGLASHGWKVYFWARVCADASGSLSTHSSSVSATASHRVSSIISWAKPGKMTGWTP